jgi:hypothetical protein
MIRSSSALPSANSCRACAPRSPSSRMRGYALRSPGVEKRRAVDKFTQRSQRIVIQHAHADKRRHGQVFGAPLDGSPPFASRLRGTTCWRGAAWTAQSLVVGTMLRNKLRFAFVTQFCARVNPTWKSLRSSKRPLAEASSYDLILEFHGREGSIPSTGPFHMLDRNVVARRPTA